MQAAKTALTKDMPERLKKNKMADHHADADGPRRAGPVAGGQDARGIRSGDPDQSCRRSPTAGATGEVREPPACGPAAAPPADQRAPRRASQRSADPFGQSIVHRRLARAKAGSHAATHRPPPNWPAIVAVVTLPVQWGDQDAFGHVNNAVPLRWFEILADSASGRTRLGTPDGRGRTGPAGCFDHVSLPAAD